MDQRFDEQLAHDAPAAGADRHADREFMLARAAPGGREEDGAVGAADDEQQDDTGQQKRQRTARILLVRHDDRLQPEMRPVRLRNGFS